MTRTAEEEKREGNAEERRALSGLEYMRQLMTGEREPSGMARLMNMRLVEVEEGRAVFTVEPDERHYNGLGIAHGGLAATLLDSALGCAINTVMQAGRVFQIPTLVPRRGIGVGVGVTGKLGRGAPARG